MRGLGFGFGRQPRQRGPSRIPVPDPLSVVIENVTNFADWLLSGVTVNNNATGNYESSGSADQTRSDASVGLHGLGRSGAALVTGVVYYADIVLKADGRNFVLVQISGASTNAYGIFDLDTNTIGDQLGLDSHTIMDLSNGWKFLRLEFTAPANDIHACNIFHATSGSNYVMAGDITKGLLLDRYVLSRNP